MTNHLGSCSKPITQMCTVCRVIFELRAKLQQNEYSSEITVSIPGEITAKDKVAISRVLGTKWRSIRYMINAESFTVTLVK